MRKREKRIRAELKRIGTDEAGGGWASRQASKRHNRGSRLTMRTIRKRLKRRGHSSTHSTKQPTVGR